MTYMHTMVRRKDAETSSKLRNHHINGFTLAEVLITLGIIGVIAAITIPALITNYRKHAAETALAKSVSALTQALKLSEQDNGSISALDTTISKTDFIKQYIMPYMKVAEICDRPQKCGYPSGTNNIYSYMKGGYGSYASPYFNGRIPFMSPDGIVYTVSFHNSGSETAGNRHTIIVDINGGKLPNTFGKDVFFLYRRTDADEISTYGYDKTDAQVKRSCSKNGDGLYCATMIARNGWKFPKDYPW